MKYQVVYESSPGEYIVICAIEKKVNALCAEGWKPQGGISVIFTDSCYIALQAMVKE